VRNYVTPRGLAVLRSELDALLGELAALDQGARIAESAALRARIAELEARLASAEPVVSEDGPADVVRFGVRATIRTGDGSERSYRIVGVDEANAAEGRIAFLAPLARALLGKRVGDVVAWPTPRGEQEVEVTAIDARAEDT
jgi:transcription elongation factor GreB